MVRAKKSLGQNFLVDTNYQRRIVAALDAQPDETVLEIGPGTGALTEHLAGSVSCLVAIEKDDALARALTARYAGRADVRIVN
ncbi:MAG: rRNA adenine N-6-methyltransferase family protein, partial [Longimicrobiales bacterium]